MAFLIVTTFSPLAISSAWICVPISLFDYFQSQIQALENVFEILQNEIQKLWNVFVICQRENLKVFPLSEFLRCKDTAFISKEKGLSHHLNHRVTDVGTTMTKTVRITILKAWTFEFFGPFKPCSLASVTRYLFFAKIIYIHILFLFKVLYFIYLYFRVKLLYNK